MPKASISLSLDEIRPDQLAPQNLNTLFCFTMERLDGQGAAIRRQSRSIVLETRSIPEPLLAELTTRLPDHFNENFGALIVQPNYEQAWKQAEIVFRDSLSATLGRIDERTAVLPKVAEDTATILQQLTSRQTFDEKFLERYDNAVKRGDIAELKVQELEAERVRQAEELRKLRQQVAARSAEPAEAELFGLLEAGDLDDALRLKSLQVEKRREEAAKLPRDLYELGTIHELRFEWPQALDAYREAWELGKDPDHGFKYAAFAAMLHRFSDAITTYEALLGIYTSPADRAKTLYSLGNVYRETHRLQQADEAYREAYDIYMGLAADPAYMQDLANTLNSIGVLYCDMRRLEEAKEVFGESLAMRRLSPDAPKSYLFAEAGTLNNLANMYLETHRLKEAEVYYGEALKAYSELSQADQKRYRYYIAHTLNNLGTLYCDMGRPEEAKDAYGKALDIRRELAEANPDAYLPDVATTLNNLANLYRATQRMKEAEEA
jgi:tetratricopeptide (TPR) repeat protein